MSLTVKHFALFICLACGLAFAYACLPDGLRAEDGLPAAVRAQLHVPVSEVGSGTYRRFGLSVYHASLWAPGGKWDAAQPYALALHYTRDVSKDTMVDVVSGDIEEQNVADDATFAHWKDVLNSTLPDIEEGDTLIGVNVPGKQAQLFYNGKKIAGIDDQAFSQAFFNVWLGETADADLREKLLGKAH